VGVTPLPATPTAMIDFTEQEKRRLQQANIDWTTPAGYQQALDYLYKEDVVETIYLTPSDVEGIAQTFIQKYGNPQMATDAIQSIKMITDSKEKTHKLSDEQVQNIVNAISVQPEAPEEKVGFWQNLWNTITGK